MGSENLLLVKIEAFQETSLDLSSEHLEAISTPMLVEALSHIPAMVTDLNLSKAALHQRSEAELIAIFNAIPETVKTLKLEGSPLHQLPHAAFKNTLDGISIEEKISIICNGLISMSLLEKQYTADLFKNIGLIMGFATDVESHQLEVRDALENACNTGNPKLILEIFRSPLIDLQVIADLKSRLNQTLLTGIARLKPSVDNDAYRALYAQVMLEESDNLKKLYELFKETTVSSPTTPGIR